MWLAKLRKIFSKDWRMTIYKNWMSRDRIMAKRWWYLHGTYEKQRKDLCGGSGMIGQANHLWTHQSRHERLFDHFLVKEAALRLRLWKHVIIQLKLSCPTLWYDLAWLDKVQLWYGNQHIPDICYPCRSIQIKNIFFEPWVSCSNWKRVGSLEENLKHKRTLIIIPIRFVSDVNGNVCSIENSWICPEGTLIFITFKSR